MKIIHLCLSCVYLDGHSYQENLLVQQNLKDGLDVRVIASTESLDTNGQVIDLEPRNYIGTDGAYVYRIPYNKKIPTVIQRKVRSYEGVLKILEDFNPDIIYFHGLSAFELRTLAQYKKNSPNVKIILDCHSDKYNSALTIPSKILHQLFYKPIFKSVLHCIDKIFCISLETMDFALEYYDAPKNKVEFYPLGGECLNDEVYFIKRLTRRNILGIDENSIVILQTGKMNHKKKILESLEQFSKIKTGNFIYLIAGNIDPSIEKNALDLICKDSRIKYLGWMNAEEMQELLCASDIYLQPGSQSATMQQSLCLRNAPILANVKSHKPFVKNNGWLINNTSEISNILLDIQKSPEKIKIMCNDSYKLALKILSYEVLASKIYKL